MDKKLLLRYIEGEVSQEEKEAVLDWVSKDEANEKYFANLVNLSVYNGIPDEKASLGELLEIKDVIASNRKKRPVIKRKYFFAAASIAILFLASNLFLLNSIFVKDKLVVDPNEVIADLIDISRLNVEASHVLYTEKGVKARLILPDSSIVWLNSDSRIIYPSKFEGDTRDIIFSGEAYFEVVKDSQRPMIITTEKGFAVRVMGTAFNLKAYDDDDDAQATLYSGKIDIIRKLENKISIIEMLPNETITINNNLTPIKSIKEVPEALCAWKNGQMLFDKTSIKEVIKTLERWHGVAITVKDDDILEYRITADFKSESMVQILELIKTISFIDYQITDNEIILKKR